MEKNITRESHPTIGDIKQIIQETNDMLIDSVGGLMSLGDIAMQLSLRRPTRRRSAAHLQAEIAELDDIVVAATALLDAAKRQARTHLDAGTYGRVTVSKPRTITSVDDPGKLWDHIARRDPDKLRLIFNKPDVSMAKAIDTADPSLKIGRFMSSKDGAKQVSVRKMR